MPETNTAQVAISPPHLLRSFKSATSAFCQATTTVDFFSPTVAATSYLPLTRVLSLSNIQIRKPFHSVFTFNFRERKGINSGERRCAYIIGVDILQNTSLEFHHTDLGTSFMLLSWIALQTQNPTRTLPHSYYRLLYTTSSSPFKTVNQSRKIPRLVGVTQHTDLISLPS